MSIKSRRSLGALAFAVLLGILSAAPAAAACLKCTYIAFNGWECFHAQDNEDGKTQCYDSNGGCHTYGSLCAGGCSGPDDEGCGPFNQDP